MLLPELILLAYFIYVVAYALVFSVSGLLYRSPTTRSNDKHSTFYILIPAYKEDAVILNSVRKALEQNYPVDQFQVVVIADTLRPETLLELEKLKVQVINVQFESSTKVKSLAAALKVLPSDVNYGVILDADNILGERFLDKVNDLVSAGQYRAVQCQRVPKNSQNRLAYLDGLSEAINNHIYRQGASALHLSASISGSAIVVDYGLLRKHILGMNSIGGFDRELELLLLKDLVKVFYFKDAVVLDEKVSSAETFQHQRKRWISSQYFYLRKYFKEGILALFHGNISFFNSAVLRNIQLPRLVNLGFLFVLTAALLPIRDKLYFEFAWWPMLLAGNLLAILIAIPREYYSLKLIQSVLSVPGLFVRMFLLLFKLRGANRSFLHTPHTIQHAHEPQ